MMRRKTIWVLFVCMIIAACGLSACSLLGKTNSGESVQPQTTQEAVSENANDAEVEPPSAAEPAEGSGLPEIEIPIDGSEAGEENGGNDGGSETPAGEPAAQPEPSDSNGQGATVGTEGEPDEIHIDENGDILLPEVP